MFQVFKMLLLSVFSSLLLLFVPACSRSSDGVQQETLAQTLEKAEKGDANAQVVMGDHYALGDGVDLDYDQARVWYEKAEKQGHPAAYYSLGLMHARGDSVPKNAALAKRWYEKAAAKGEARAQFNMGYMYQNGRGFKRDPKMAISWYGKASALGLDRAQLYLGRMYLNGDGVTVNFETAYRWLLLASHTKSGEGVAAGKELEGLSKKLKPEQLKKAQEWVVQYEKTIQENKNKQQGKLATLSKK